MYKQKFIRTTIRVASTLVVLFFVAVPSITSAAETKDPIVFGGGFSLTGPIASLGEDEARAVRLFVKQKNVMGGIAGHPLKVLIKDTGGSTQKAVVAMRRMTKNDEVMGLLCCTTSPESLAALDLIQDAQLPNISLGSATSIVEPVSKRRWIFKASPKAALMFRASVADMKARNIKTVAYFGFDTAVGKDGLSDVKSAADTLGINVVAVQWMDPSDSNVAAQAARLIGSNPEAILINGNPPGANIAQDALVSIGYSGAVYQTYGVANDTYLRLTDESYNGTRLSVTPIITHAQLSESKPYTAAIQKFARSYEETYHELPSTFAALAYAAMQLYSAAAESVVESGTATLDDTVAFRSALRDALEGLGPVKTANGIHDISEKNHVGMNPDSIIMVTVEDGSFVLAK